MEQQIVLDPAREAAGADNRRRNRTYQNASTVCIRPVIGGISPKVVQSWENLQTPMNHPFLRMTMIGYEVGDAYSTAIEQVLAHPDLSSWPYILTLEHDNMPPPDGVLKLVRRLEDNPHLSAVGGLYFTKGEEGQPMIYGDPHAIPFGFQPVAPVPGALVECNGLGMGFTLFRTDLFKDDRLGRPLFETVQTYEPGTGAKSYTQDLHFFERARKLGYRFACDCDCRVGHYDVNTDLVW